MAREANRRADANADGHPPPRSPSPPAVTEGGSWSKVKKNLRARVPFVPSSSGPRRPSCWGSVGIHRIGRSRSRSRMGGGDDEDMPQAVRAVVSRVCLGDRGRCGCSGKAGASVGPRSLLQRNDFYCDDCNTHRLHNSLTMQRDHVLEHRQDLMCHEPTGSEGGFAGNEVTSKLIGMFRTLEVTHLAGFNYQIQVIF